MRKVDQRRLLPPEEPIGDCFSACIASILELPLEEVPVFSTIPAAKDKTWIYAVNDWLRLRGYCLVAYEDAHAVSPAPECFHIASGPSPDVPDPSASSHAVIVYGDRLVHNPNRTQQGITEIRHRWLLVPTDWTHVKTPVKGGWPPAIVGLVATAIFVWIVAFALAIYDRLG